MNRHTLEVRLRPAGIVLFLCLLLGAEAVAQAGGGGFNAPGSTTSQIQIYQSQGAALLLTVYSHGRAPLDRQSVVKLFNKGTGTTVWQTTTDKAEAAFGDLAVGQYDIEASAVGYLTAHKEINIQSAINTYHDEIVLERDPFAVELSAPNAAQMPPKARKQTQRGVTALKSGDLKEAEKRLDAAYKLVPSSGDINFLLGYLYFQRKDFAQAQTYLGNATNFDPRNIQALTMLGRLSLQQKNYQRARTALEQAVADDPEHWTAHKLLADTYMSQREYEKARAQAQLAIDKGKGGGNDARVVLGEALANLGRNREAIQELNAFLQGSPASPLSPQVRELIAQLERRASEPSSGTAPAEVASLVDADSLLADDELRLSIRTWEPPGIDDVRPPVAAVTCPYEHVIKMTGERVKELVDDVAKFSAIEDLLHQQVDELGNPITKQTRKFNYVVAISEAKPGLFAIDEYRGDRVGLADYPDRIASHGFTSLALVFHPDMRENFQMTCEGLGEWHGQATWLVHFRQRDDRPNRIHDYLVGDKIYPANLKGRAWITADKFQIVRIESELVKPMPKIQLLSERQIVEYGPIPFPKKNLELWLPKSAELYFDFRKHRYFRRHSFDHYMLFSVDADQKDSRLKEDPPSAEPKSPQN